MSLEITELIQQYADQEITAAMQAILDATDNNDTGAIVRALLQAKIDELA